MNKELVAKWTKYGILKEIDEDYKGILAQVLENQRLANETSPFDASFKRLSIPIVRRVFASLRTLNKLISMQPISGPSGLIHYISNNKETIKQVTASTHKTKTVWNVEAIHDIAVGMNVGQIDAEVELAVILSQDLNVEIERRVFNNIRNSVALRKTLMFTNPKAARIEILDFIQEIKKRYHRSKANWIVTSPEIASCLFNKQDDNFSGSLGLNHWGVWEDVNVYVDNLAPMGKMLIGYKGEIPFDSGYIYSPYVPLSLTAVELNPDTFAVRRWVLHQSAHQMVDNTYFASVDIINFNND